MKRPSDYTKYPWSSVLQNSECETVALNIMKILKRTGNEFRQLTWEEYKTEREKDGQSSRSEGAFFDMVIKYCLSHETARLFSKEWED